MNYDKPFGWFGGKFAMLPNLLPLIPPHKVYVEVFGGSASLLFNKRPSNFEVYNDLDEGLTHFFRALRNHLTAAKLGELLKYTPYSRAEYYHCLKNWETTDDPVEKARQWYVAAYQYYGGRFNQGWKHDCAKNLCAKAFANKVRRLDSFTRRLRYVQIDCRDFRKVIEAYDSPETFFYLDPPYVPDSLGSKNRKYYRVDFTLDDHRGLVKALLKIKGKALLSGYDNRLYLPLKGWRTKTFDQQVRSVNNRIFKNRNALRRTEKIWYNYEV